jgi:amino-acid N-acetyltransferase
MPNSCWPAVAPGQQPTDTAFYLQHCVKACKAAWSAATSFRLPSTARCCWRSTCTTASAPWWWTRSWKSLREATADDVGGILHLIEPFEKDGTLVKRSRTEIERDVANYTIIEHDGVIFACAALYPYPEGKTAEMAALTVSPQSQGQGDGEKLLKRIEQRARAMGPGQHLRADHPHHALVHQARLRPGRPRLAARSAQAQVQLGPRSQVLVKKLG